MATSLATAQDAYLDNADYDSDGSVAKAKLFRTACRQLLVLLPADQSRRAGNNTQQVSFDPAMLRQSLQEVEAWLALNDTSTPAVVHPDFSYARGDI